MKKLIALLLAVTMLASLTACGGSAEPVETTPATTEPAVVETEAAPTEAPTEEPTEAPTEPRVAPVDFTPVDTTTLPEPTSVDELLENGEDTQTVHFDTLEEYEDLLWSLGYEEVRLAGTHIGLGGLQGSCINSALTYNSQAFRLDFSYLVTYPEGYKGVNPEVQENWMMCGMKAQKQGNITNLDTREFVEAQKLSMFTVGADVVVESGALDVGEIITNGEADTTTASTSNYESELLNFVAKGSPTSVFVSVIYYPQTGSLYNYMQRPIGAGKTSTTLDPGDYSESGQATVYGLLAQGMTFHYLFPAK